MITFLSPEAKRVVTREYFVRVASVWALLFAAVAVAVAVLLLPTYVLLLRQLEALSLQAAAPEDEANTEHYEAVHAALSKAHVLARQLNASDAEPAASAVLREIQKAQTSSIVISSFFYEDTGAEAKGVRIEGIAATRESLAQFSAALERNPLFARAEVPVADLAADRDLSFTLTIVLANGDE